MLSALLDQGWWYWLTGFGDLKVILPAAIVVLLWLILRGRTQAALWWAITIVGCGASVFLLKLGFYTGVLDLAGSPLDNPSGHSAMSMMFYGSTTWIIGRELNRWWRGALLTFGVLFTAAIGMSRVSLGSHSPSDVVIGLTVGALWAIAFVALGYRGTELQRRWVLSLAVLVVGTALATHDLRVTPHVAWRELLSLPTGFGVRL
jgi:membrane-associated phospholipid phosphatase